MRIAIVQTSSSQDKHANREAAVRLIGEASASSPDLVVLPEAMMADFAVDGGSVGELAEPLDGEFVTALRQSAQEHGVAVIAGMFETSDDSARPYNTLLAIGSDGELLGAYHKIHLYDAFGFRESDQLTPGEIDPVVVKIGGHTLGLMTCYDLRFPEMSRALVDAGADVLVVPAAWVRGPLKEQHWSTLLAARAIENTCYVVAAAQNGKKYSALSQVVDPLGVPVVSIGADDGIALAEVTADRVREIRRRNPSLDNRRFTVAPR